ncbi:MAG: hypothetical protein LBK42_05195 [Propionibacteriaceae bacterium]|jgi:hypothetical protein|nr:hypothetical protein [Propionibacteriaceae bacterium]
MIPLEPSSTADRRGERNQTGRSALKHWWVWAETVPPHRSPLAVRADQDNITLQGEWR